MVSIDEELALEQEAIVYGAGRQPPCQGASAIETAPFRSGVQNSNFQSFTPCSLPTTSFINHEVLYLHCLNCLVGLQCIRPIHHQLPVGHNFPSVSRSLIGFFFSLNVVVCQPSLITWVGGTGGSAFYSIEPKPHKSFSGPYFLVRHALLICDSEF